MFIAEMSLAKLHPPMPLYAADLDLEISIEELEVFSHSIHSY